MSNAKENPEEMLKSRPTSPSSSGAIYPSVPQRVRSAVCVDRLDAPKSAILTQIGSRDAMRIFYCDKHPARF